MNSHAWVTGFVDDDEDDDMGQAPSSSGPSSASSDGQSTGSRAKRKTGADTPALDKYGNDMTLAAEEGRLDPVVGREVEIERLAQILCRRKKNNPVLIGEPGVGKSAIVEGSRCALFSARSQEFSLTSVLSRLTLARW